MDSGNLGGDAECNASPVGDPVCTLRAAIEHANDTDGDDAITFDVTGTITLTSSLPPITTPISIAGPGGDGITVDCASQLVARTAFAFTGASSGSTYSVSDLTLENCSSDNTAGGGAIRFSAAAPSTLNLNNLTITGASTSAGPGGAVMIAAGNTATVTGGSFSDNTASGMGGAIFNAGTLTIDGATIADNTSGGHGGGVASVLPSAGGLTITGGTVLSGNDAGTQNGGGLYVVEGIISLDSILENSTITDNSAENGGGIAVSNGSLAITATTIDNNTATTSGGGVFLGNDGGNGAVVMVNSTVSTNTAASGGGFGAATGNTAPTSVINSTIALNTGNGFDLGANPQLIIAGDAAGGQFYKNLLAGNTAANCATPFNHSGDEVNAGSNVSTDASCGLTQSTDIEDATANLDDLGDYTGTAGATQTHRILAGSDAIDAGSATIGEASDQRGAPTADGDKSGAAERDAGAYEYAGFSAIEFTADSYTEKENDSPAMIGARRFGNLTQGSSATIMSVPGMSSATVDEDYEALTSPGGDVTWAAGDGSEQLVDLVIIDEDAGAGEVEGDETVGLTLANVPVGVDVGSVDPATLTITDFEEGEFNIDPLDYQVTEGTDTKVTVTITRTNGTDGPSEVQVSTANGGNTETDDATAGDDYTALTEEVVMFAAGVASATVNINITDDEDFEVNPESFSVTISRTDNTGRAVIGDNDTANVTITDNDGAQPGTFSLTSDEAMTAETAGTVTFDVQRTDGSDCRVDVTYTLVSDTADLGSDFSDADTTAPAESGTLTFNVDDTDNKTITIALNDDNERESTETFSVELTAADVVVGDPATCSDDVQATIGDADMATVTLTSDELERFQFDITPAPTGSESSGQAIITVEPVEDDTGSSTITGTAVTVEITTADGTATAPGDYTATTQKLTWTDGETGAKTITVPVIADDENEGDETFFVMLSAETTETTEITGTNPATVTITDLPGVRIVDQPYVSDDESSSIAVVVERFGDASLAAQVEVATQADGGTATQDEDFPKVTRTAAWAAGESGTRTVNFLLTDDELIEGDETFVVALQNSQNVEIRELSQATLTITDDDTGFRFAEADYSATESDGAVTVLVERLGDFSAEAMVEFTTVDGTATEPNNYIATSGKLTWDPGVSDPMPITVKLINDEVVNADRDFTIELSNPMPAGNAILVDPQTTTVTIEDDEDKFAFADDSYLVTEGTPTVSVVVERRGSGVGEVTVDVTTADGTAVAGSDYTTTITTLTWTDGNTDAMTVNVPIGDDQRIEENESFTLTLSNAGGDIDIGETSTTTVEITDNDMASLVVSETGGNTTITEGGNTDSFGVALATQPNGAVVVTISPPDRVSATPSTLNFTAANWDTPQSVSLQIGDDQFEQDNRSRRLSMTATSTADNNYDSVMAELDITIIDAGAPPASGGGGGGGGGGSSSGSLGLPLLALLGLAAVRRRRR